MFGRAYLFTHDLLTVDLRSLSLLMAWVIFNGAFHARLELAPFGFFTPDRDLCTTLGYR